MNEIQSSNKKLTFAMIDSPDDTWYPAIVADYNGPQEYGEILMGFQQDALPSEDHLQRILDLLSEDY